MSRLSRKDQGQLLQVFPPKEVSWEVVRNIANSLTNQLYMADVVDIRQAHMSEFHQGPVREFLLEDGRKGHWRDAGWDNQGWHAFDEEDVQMLYWESGTSGSGLQATKIDGKWMLCFIPSKENPSYRGVYYDMYKNPDSVENVDAAYVYQNR